MLWKSHRIMFKQYKTVIFLHQALFIEAFLSIWLWAETRTLSSTDVQSRAAGPEQDINLTEGQFVHSEELWGSNRISVASTVMKNKNDSQARSWLSELRSNLNDKCAPGLTLTDPHESSKLHGIKHNCAALVCLRLDKHFPAVCGWNG